jgi:hypothetical protein
MIRVAGFCSGSRFENPIDGDGTVNVGADANVYEIEQRKAAGEALICGDKAVDRRTFGSCKDVGVLCFSEGASRERFSEI